MSQRGEQGFLEYAPLTLFVQVHGGSVALEGIASRELDFFSGLIVKYISDALSEWTHGGNRGEVNLKLEVKANVQADAQVGEAQQLSYGSGTRTFFGNWSCGS